MHQNKLLYLSFFIIFIWSVSFANNNFLHSSSIENEIHAKGARQFISSHDLNDRVWDIIEFNIANGNERWISLGFELLEYSDAGVTDTLIMDLGDALNKNPSKVFHEIKKISAKKIETGKMLTDEICGSFENEFNDSPDYIPTKDIKELINREKMIKTINDPNFNLVKQQCIASIRDSIASLKKIEPTKGKS